VYTKEHPSKRYMALLDLYRGAHEDKPAAVDLAPRNKFTGISLAPHVRTIARLVRETGARTILDYGSGKASLYQDSPHHPPGSRFKVMEAWGGAEVTCYDPGYEPYAEDYQGSYDGVVATDVLEHIPEDDIAWVLGELFGQARLFVYAVATCYPAKKLLPDGENAHCTIKPPDWWQARMAEAGQNHRDVRWLLCTKERSFWSLRKRKGVMKKGVKLRYFAS